MQGLVLRAMNFFIDSFQIPLTLKLQEAREVWLGAFVERRACTGVKMMEEGVEGGEPEELAPGFFSFQRAEARPFFYTFTMAQMAGLIDLKSCSMH